MDELHEEIVKAAEADADDNVSEEEETETEETKSEKAEQEPEPISEELFNKAMSVLAEEFTVDDIGRDPEIQKALEIDTAGFLKGLVGEVDTSHKDMARGINMRLSAFGVVLKKAMEKLDRIEGSLHGVNRAPVREPKGNRAPTKPLQKSFGSGEGVKGPDDLTKSELKEGFNQLMDDALAKGEAREVERIGVESGRFEATGGLITPRMRKEIWTKVFAA